MKNKEIKNKEITEIIKKRWGIEISPEHPKDEFDFGCNGSQDIISNLSKHIDKFDVINFVSEVMGTKLFCSHSEVLQERIALLKKYLLQVVLAGRLGVAHESEQRIGTTIKEIEFLRLLPTSAIFFTNYPSSSRTSIDGASLDALIELQKYRDLFRYNFINKAFYFRAIFNIFVCVEIRFHNKNFALYIPDPPPPLPEIEIGVEGNKLVWVEKKFLEMLPERAREALKPLALPEPERPEPERKERKRRRK